MIHKIFFCIKLVQKLDNIFNTFNGNIFITNWIFLILETIHSLEVLKYKTER